MTESSSQRHPYFKRIVSNIGWLTFDRIVRLGFGVLITVAIARHLGPEKFGQLNYGLAIVALIAVLAAMGLDSVVQRDLVKAPADKDRLLATCFIIKGIAGILGYLVLVIIVRATVLEPLTRATCLIVGLSLLGNAAVAFDNWFQSQTQAKFTVYAQSAAFFAATAMRVALLFIGAGLLAFAWTYSIEPILGAVFLFILFRVVAGSLPNWTFDKVLAHKWLRESWPLLLSGLAIIVCLRIDQIMLAHLANQRALGVYSAAVKVSEVGYFISPILGASFFPSIVRTRELGTEAYNIRRQHYFDLSVVIAIGIALPITFLSRPIIEMLYGSTYAEAVPILCALVWATVFVFVGGARQQYLICEGFMKFSFAATLAAALLNIALNFLLIPRYQGFGAAIATLISYGLSAVLSSFLYPPTRLMGWEQLRSFNLFAAVYRLAVYSKNASAQS